MRRKLWTENHWEGTMRWNHLSNGIICFPLVGRTSFQMNGGDTTVHNFFFLSHRCSKSIRRFTPQSAMDFDLPNAHVAIAKQLAMKNGLPYSFLDKYTKHKLEWTKCISPYYKCEEPEAKVILLSAVNGCWYRALSPWETLLTTSGHLFLLSESHLRFVCSV